MLVQCSASAFKAYRISSFSSSSSPKLLSLFPNTNLLSALSFPKSFAPPNNTLKWRPFTTTAAAAAANGTEAYTFLAEDSVSWASLGVSDGLSRALSNAGLHRPSLVQAACIPAILSGVDVVVAAETGSGKTHGYLVPLFDKLCRTSNVPPPLDDQRRTPSHHVSLVLCPNVMLCEQVVQMANSLCNDSGEPLLKTVAICGRQGLSVREPDVIVSTPVALLNYLYAIDPERHRRADFIRDVKYVVFDEADLLLCGSFQNQVIRLINMLRFDEKQLSRLESGDGGAQDSVSFTVEASKTEDGDVTEDGEILEEEEDNDDASEVVDVEPEVGNRKDWRRVRKMYKRSKQYIFVAATLPTNGKQTAGGVLKRIFPDANWVSGNYLHRQNPRLTQKWIEVTTDSQVDALINAVNNGLNNKKVDSGFEIVRTMVFTNTVEAADAVSNILTRADIRCLRYHKNVSLEERTENLVDFRCNGGVFVCTDSAARGLDVSNVSHVIQAEFATSAVDFLHRVGRTARAGQVGLVTSLYNESNRELVAAVRQAEELGLPLEKAFSRKRSFRKKLKKRGLTRRDGALLVGR